MRTSRSRGFTYIECLIVLVLMGMLVAIALPRFLRAQTHARQSEAVTQLKSLHAAMVTQQVRPVSIHVYSFDPPRGNRYSYLLDNGCPSSEDRSMSNAVQSDFDVCVGADLYANPMFPFSFYPNSVVNPVWGQRAIDNGMGANAGTFGQCGMPYYWDYLAYAAGDVDFDNTGDYEDAWDGADTWLVSSSDGQLQRVCPATSSPLFAPAGEPFMVYDDSACN